MNRRYFAALGILLLTAGVAARAATPVPLHKPVPGVPHKVPARLPDGELEKAIRARLQQSKISTDHFQVHVQGGVATLEGKTDVLQHKGTATRLAKNAGAVTVVNHIAASQVAKDKAAKNLAAGRRRAQIKRSDTTARSARRSS